MRLNAIRILSLGVLFTLVACTGNKREVETPRPGSANTDSALILPSPTGTKVPTVSPPATHTPDVTPLPETHLPLVTGQVVEGYGRHDPIPGLSLWIAPQTSGYPVAGTTDTNGRFQLTDLPVGEVITINVGPHLSFPVLLTSTYQTVDLGVLKCPTMHPPNVYYWTPYAVRDLAQLTSRGEKLSFVVCKQDALWQRPTEAEQRDYVWSKTPFRERETNYLRLRFQDSAILYDSIDLFYQGFTEGLRLDALGAERIYLSGLWTAASSPVELSDCVYTPEALEDLFERKQIEVWLLGYRATEVYALGAADADIDEDTWCDSHERTCTARPGYHYAVVVQPAPGYQAIRFDGHQSAMAVHVMVEGREITQLPQRGSATIFKSSRCVSKTVRWGLARNKTRQ